MQGSDPFPTYCFMPSSSFLCSRGDLRNNFTYIINPRMTDIVITTPTAISIPNAREPRKGLRYRTLKNRSDYSVNHPTKSRMVLFSITTIRLDALSVLSAPHS